MPTAFLLTLAMTAAAPPGIEFVVTVTYYEGDLREAAGDKSAKVIREYRQKLAYARPNVWSKASEMSYGWVPKADSRRRDEVHELVHTSVEAAGDTDGGVRLIGHVAHWQDTDIKHTKKLDGDYKFGAPVIIRLSAPRPEQQVWAVVLVTKPPTVQSAD